MKNKELTEK